MAAKEKKLTVIKHLKDNQSDKDKVGVGTKTKRGRKPNLPLNDNKLNCENKTCTKLTRRKRKKNDSEDNDKIYIQKRARRAILDSEEPGLSKTPPPINPKLKKAHLEKELGDLLENATGRNTPLLPRNKKLNEKDEEVDVLDDRNSSNLSKTKKLSDKELEDDNVSVKSFATLLRGRKLPEKETDEDSSSVRSMNVKVKKNDGNNEDSSSVKSLIRPNANTKGSRKKKSVLAAIAVKKKIFIRRGRPKKGKEQNDLKIKHSEEKRVPRVKVPEKNLNEAKQKRIIKKPLKFQNKIKDQSRMRPSLAIKNQKLKKAKMKLCERSQGSRQTQRGETEMTKDPGTEQSFKERMKSEGQTREWKDRPDNDETESCDLGHSNLEFDLASKKRKPVARKRKVKKEEVEVDRGEKYGDIYFFAEGEGGGNLMASSKAKIDKTIKSNQAKPKATKKKIDQKKQRRQSGIHFETTRSPDDSSVIIVQPRLGPKIKGTRRVKPILPKNEMDRRMKEITKELVPGNASPKKLTAPSANFGQISSTYFLHSIPNFNVFAANPTLIRNVNSNFEAGVSVPPSDISCGRDVDFPFGPKVSSKEIVMTPSGIVLSGSRIISSGNPSSSTVCFNGSSSNFVSESSIKDLVFPARDAIENAPSSSLIYQSSTTVIQPQSNVQSKTSILVKRPETKSTSLISAAAGALVINSNVTGNGGMRVTNAKSHAACTDTIASEKASEGGFNVTGDTSAVKCFKNESKIDFIPSIPVAKNVNDLIMLKNRSSPRGQVVEKSLKQNGSSASDDSFREINCGPSKVDGKMNSSADVSKTLRNKKENRKIRKRTTKNVRNIRGSSRFELTFSEPETSCCEHDAFELYRTISCERLRKNDLISEQKTNALWQLRSEPIANSESLVPFETSSILLLAKKENSEEKLEKKEKVESGSSPKIKGAVEVCRFSKENEEALKEFGLDSDLDQTKSENDSDSPSKSNKCESENDVAEISKAMKIKEEDNVLKEMPIRRLPNFFRRTSAYRVDFKSPSIHRTSEYLSLSPSKPPTVIDKLLEKNKSLKKAELEGRIQNSLQNFSDDTADHETAEFKSKKCIREAKTRKFSRTVDSRRGSHKKFVRGIPGTSIYERRGSNPEIYSDNYLHSTNEVANENLPLSQTHHHEDGFPRRGSIDYDSVQKVLDRRCSLPSSGKSRSESKLSKSLEDVNKLKTENIKGGLLSPDRPLGSKNCRSETRPRVINIITSNRGFKKGKNLMEEVGLNLGISEMNLMNGERRRVSVDSSNSESESLQKLMDGLTDVSVDKNLVEVPYLSENSKRGGKMRLSYDGKNSAGKIKRSSSLEETPEDLVTKETILSALGLQSLKAAAQNAQKKKEVPGHVNPCPAENGKYTGTLKTVIKIQRQEKKGSSKSPIKMVYKASSSSSVGNRPEESSTADEPEALPPEDSEEVVAEEKNGNGKAKSLVIPEKASSFSIHPGRMCSDVCTYCFGKFGLLDTPCHIAQLKDADKRRNILATEVHLTADSCLCDACFRHVDKKSNCPTFTDKKNDIRRKSVRKQSCIVQNCSAESQHSIRRKLFLKLKKSIGRKVVLDPGKMEKLQPGQSLTFCNRHIYWIDYFMSCGICKKRLTSVNMYRVSSEVLELNSALSSDEIPAILTENRFLCKICNCFASIRVKCKDPNEMSSSHRQFYETCRKRILKCHGMDVPDSEAEGETKVSNDRKHVKRSKKSSKPTATVTNENSKSDNDVEMSMEEMEKAGENEKNRKEIKEVSHMNIPPKANGNLDFGGVSITPTTTEVNPTQIHVKLGNLNIGALGNLNIGQDVRHGTRGGDIQCFPTETELALRAHFDLKPSAEDEGAKTPRKGFEKCTTTIQFSPETKNLFYNLQMPYGNQSSFFRHLILLEKYFRSGDLVVSRNADPKAVNYISSVQNRIRSYEGVHNPVKKSPDISPSLSILPQTVKTESKNGQDGKTGALPSRPFTLTPMPPNSFSAFFKNSPLSQIQATVQNLQPSIQNQNQGAVSSLLKSSLQCSSKFGAHLKPEVSITSVPNDSASPSRIGQVGKPSVLTKKIQENLRNLASKNQAKQPNQARAVILNRTVGGQKQSLVQVTTGGKTIHLTLSQFRRIQQMQMRKKQYLEHQAKMLKGRDDQAKNKGKPSEDFVLKNLSPELDIQEVRSKSHDEEVFPLISEVRSLAGEDATWDKRTDSGDSLSGDCFPKIPKTLSVSVTKIPLPDLAAKEQPEEPLE